MARITRTLPRPVPAHLAGMVAEYRRLRAGGERPGMAARIAAHTCSTNVYAWQSIDTAILHATGNQTTWAPARARCAVDALVAAGAELDRDADVLAGAALAAAASCTADAASADEHARAGIAQFFRRHIPLSAPAAPTAAPTAAPPAYGTPAPLDACPALGAPAPLALPAPDLSGMPAPDEHIGELEYDPADEIPYTPAGWDSIDTSTNDAPVYVDPLIAELRAMPTAMLRAHADALAAELDTDDTAAYSTWLADRALITAV